MKSRTYRTISQALEERTQPAPRFAPAWGRFGGVVWPSGAADAITTAAVPLVAAPLRLARQSLTRPIVVGCHPPSRGVPITRFVNSAAICHSHGGY